MPEATTAKKRTIDVPAKIKWPLAAFLVGLAIFSLTSWNRLAEHSFDNHYVYMADGILNGRLHLDGRPPHMNDWAKYNGKWYVSFPPLPGILMVPGVAIWGMAFNDRAFSLLFAAAGPALLLLLMMLLTERGTFSRRLWELAVVSGLYGLGTVYYFSAVQGSVWYTAHMVGGVVLLLFAIFSLDGRHPALAGLFLGLAFACRPPMLVAFPFFLYEMMRPHLEDAPTSQWESLVHVFQKAGLGLVVKKLVLFGLPILLVIGGFMWMNWVRWDDPFEFGHKLLQVRWTPRIEKWGLFHFHYLARNLSVAFTLLPWLSATEPHLQVSFHGLAIWFTTPVLLYILWPTVHTRFYTALIATVLCVALPNLLYQNSGWVQFGYRFALDYMPFMMVMVAASGRKFGKLFAALCIFALAVNLFGAITFDRVHRFYPSQAKVAYYQPD